MYVVWLRKETSEAKEEYLKTKTETRRVVRNAVDEKWLEMGKSLQTIFRETRKGSGKEWQRRMKVGSLERCVMKMVS